MDNLPDNFTRSKLYAMLEKKQNELVKKTRKDFVDKTIKDIEMCEKNIILEFPEKIWNENRVIMIKELLERFGKLKLTTEISNYSIVKLTDNENNIPTSVTKITIQLMEN